MQTRKFSAPTLAVSVLALALGACGSVEHRKDYSSFTPIEVIESNYVESTNDAEIVFTETPWQAFVA